MGPAPGAPLTKPRTLSRSLRGQAPSGCLRGQVLYGSLSGGSRGRDVLGGILLLSEYRNPLELIQATQGQVCCQASSSRFLRMRLRFMCLAC